MQLPPWHIVEHSILSEKKWLKSIFDFGPYTHKYNDFFSVLSSDEMLRQISIAIVSGKISAREITTSSINGLWTDNANEWELGEKEERHGGDWHRAMMNLVRKYFNKDRFEVITEPTLNWGRADLGVFKDAYQDLYVEIGTTSLFKVWFNTLTMHNVIFLYIPTTNLAIEFKTNEPT